MSNCKPHSPETRAKMAEALARPETRAKMAEAARNRSPETRGMSDLQFQDFRLFRRKGFNRQEAAALAWGVK